MQFCIKFIIKVWLSETIMSIFAQVIIYLQTVCTGHWSVDIVNAKFLWKFKLLLHTVKFHKMAFFTFLQVDFAESKCCPGCRCHEKDLR